MQKAVSLLILSAVLLSILLCGCDSSGKEEETTDNSESISVAIEKSSPITKGNLITKAKIDGNNNINVEFYDNNGNLAELFVWDGENQKSHTVMTYSESKKMITKEELTPTGNHSLFTSYQYDSSDALVQSTVSEYEDGILTKATTYDKDNNVIGYSVSERNDSDQVTKIERYDGADKLQEYFVYDYDKNGRTSKSSTYNGDGTLKKYTVFTFNDDGRLIEEHYYDGNDKLTEYYVYDYYESGNRKSLSYYGADGKLISSDSFEDTTQQ